MILIYCEDLGRHFIFPDLGLDDTKGFIELDVCDLEFVSHFESNGYDTEESALRFAIFLIHFHEMVDWF